jgi:hypothetical protein
MGHHEQLNASFCITIGGTAIIRIAALVLERKGHLNLINFIHFSRQSKENEKTDDEQNPLNERMLDHLNNKNRRKLNFICRLCNSSIDAIIYYLTILCFFMTIFASYLAYFDQDKKGLFSPFLLLFWSFISTVASWFVWTSALSYSLIPYITYKYLNLRFEQLNEDISMTTLSINQSNITPKKPIARKKDVKKSSFENSKSSLSKSVSKIISEHNQLSRLISLLNQAYSIALFLVYLILACDFNIYLHRTIKSDPRYMPIFSIIFNISFLVIDIFLITVTSVVPASVAESAQSSYEALNSIMARSRMAKLYKKNPVLNYSALVVLSSLIEKIGGPTIGFYCYDLFPFNSDTLFDYFSSLISFYFLLSDNFFKN